MKSYNHLWEALVSDDNIVEAIRTAARSKAKKNFRHRQLRMLAERPVDYIAEVRGWIENFQPQPHHIKTINDGISAKKREIVVPTYQELIVMHALLGVLKPIFLKGMYYHSYASIPGKGTHACVKVVKKWIQRDGRNTKYCMKLDIRHCFQSVPQDRLLSRLERTIHDRRVFNLLKQIIESEPEGLPLGFPTSHWLLNWYLTPLDHYIKQELEIRHYARFMDDMVLLGGSKRKLHKARWLVSKLLINEYRLELKSNWQLYRIDLHDTNQFLDFLGFKFYRTDVGLRSRVALRTQRVANRISKKSTPTVYDARRLLAYAGNANHCDRYSWFEQHLFRKASPSELRRLISNTARRFCHVV